MWSERTRCSARPVSFSSAVRSSAANTISSSDCCRVLVAVCEATRDFLKKAVVQVDEQAKEDAKSCGAERCWCLFDDALERTSSLEAHAGYAMRILSEFLGCSAWIARIVWNLCSARFPLISGVSKPI
jgi:hypothetical protein